MNDAGRRRYAEFRRTPYLGGDDLRDRQSATLVVAWMSPPSFLRPACGGVRRPVWGHGPGRSSGLLVRGCVASERRG